MKRGLQMYSIGQLCGKVGVSRSTLLYYDAIGLLHPSIRTEKKYRYYSEQDFQRLKRIYLYREIGMPLVEIRRLLDSPDNMEPILEKHLGDLQQSMLILKTQQQSVIHMLSSKSLFKQEAVSTKALFLKVLHKAGLNEGNLEDLHIEFEKLSPHYHQAFLEFLEIPQAEIVQIRAAGQSKI
jgi:DNA-binding transcriptional MerR regulator